MKTKYLLLAIATVAIAPSAFAQYSQDAIRFSTGQTGSTSRIRAIGNANIAVGGDLTSVGGNPAGLGFFTRSEVSITPEFNMSKVNSSYVGSNNTDKKNTGNFNNASVVFYNQLTKGRGQSKTEGWLSVNWGASYNRTNDFYQNTYYKGKNTTSSVADYYAYLGNKAIDDGFSLDGYLEGWARNQQLINNNDDPNTYVAAPAFGGTQSNVITSSGGQTEYNFSFGANYSNKLYLGMGIGFTNIRYNSTSNFLEDNLNFDNNLNFLSTYTRDQVTKGNGVNGRLGLIYKPVEAVRIGATVTTPTWYSIDDNSYEGLATRYVGGPNYSTQGDNYQASYNLRTPFKVAGGLAVFIGKYGFLTGDVEFIDYTSTKITSDEYDVTDDNNDIKRNYQSAVNARFGAEARLPGSLFLRGGYGIQGSPFKTGGSDIKTASGGLGYRFGNYYADVTYTHVKNSVTQYPYDIAEYSPPADIRNRNSNVFLTVGLRF